jgi:hypothetical protein
MADDRNWKMCRLNFPRYNINRPCDLLKFEFAELVAAFDDTPKWLGLTVVDEIRCLYDCSTRTVPQRCFCSWQMSIAWGTYAGEGGRSKHLPKTGLWFDPPPCTWLFL